MIRISDNNFKKLGNIKHVTSSLRKEELNGENILDFTAIIDDTVNEYLDESATVQEGANYFDISEFKKSYNGDNTYTVEVKSEHVSYRLNNPEYNVEYFTETGTPEYILGKILEGTIFTVGTVELPEVVTYSAQEAKSRRALLMEFVAYIYGELEFSELEISILEHRGSIVQKPLIRGKHVTIVDKTVNKRQKNEDGSYFTSYSCEPIITPDIDYALGDELRLIQPNLGIDEVMRVLSIETDLYNPSKTKFKFGNYINSLASSLYRIETTTVVKDKVYNGTRIGPTYGFENVSSDKRHRSYFRADGMKFQTGDGSGEVWRDRLWFEYDPGTDQTILKIDGVISTEMLEAIKANIDIVISNTVIVNNLYAQYGRIADLTVSELNTSFKKILNYLVGNIEDVRYRRIYEDKVEVWVCTTLGAETEQMTGANNALLYWTDGTFTEMGTDETSFPVFVYVYDELLKREEGTELVNNTYIPYIIEGRGDGVTPMSGRFKSFKDVDGYNLTYYRRGTGAIRQIILHDDGIITNPGLNPIFSLNVLEQQTTLTASIEYDYEINTISIQESYFIAIINMGYNASSDGTLQIRIESYGSVIVDTIVKKISSGGDFTSITIPIHNISVGNYDFIVYVTSSVTLTPTVFNISFQRFGLGLIQAPYMISGVLETGGFTPPSEYN